MKPPIELEEAQARLLALVEALPVEDVPVDAALGRYLARPLLARRSQPPADLSAMDGYAICGDGPWALIGESRAGHPFAGKVAAGQAVRISTGALMPEGADRVLIQEDADTDGNRGLVGLAGDAPKPGQHIRREGFDFDSAATLLDEGCRLGPAAIALALAGGHSQVTVRKKPAVAIIDCGDELSADPAKCERHQIPASNGAMLGAMAATIPCAVDRFGPVPDRLDAIVDVFNSVADADLVVTSGGASVGDHDLIRPSLEAVGAEIEFWRVAIKPGKPLMVARRGAQIVLGLPGNPASSYVTAFLFMLPVLRAMSGSRMALPSVINMPLGADIGAGGARREFRRAVWESGHLLPVDETDSSALRALANSNALIDRPARAYETKAGTFVPAYLLENGGNA